MGRILLILMLGILCCELIKADLRNEMIDAHEQSRMTKAYEVILQMQ